MRTEARLSVFHAVAAAVIQGVAIVGLLLPGQALAQTPLLPEREPNDDVALARAFEAPARIYGALAKADTDVFRLVVDDDAATQLFSVLFEGPPGGAVTLAFTTAQARSPILTLTSSHAEARARADRVLLPADTYLITIKGDPGPYSLTIGAKRLRPYVLTAGRERERADSVSAFTDSAAFVLPGGEAWLRWAPGADRYDIDILVMGGAPVKLALHDSAGVRLAQDSGHGMRAVEVPKGNNYLNMVGAEGILIVLHLRRAGTAAPVDAPLLLVAEQAAKGRLEARSEARYVVRIEDGARLYRVSATGAGVKSLAWTTIFGERLLDARADTGAGGPVAAFDNIALPAGEHRFVVSGGPGDYTLLLAAVPMPASTGPAPTFEREPNGGGAFADDLRFGAKRAGFITAPGDVDVYRFHVSAPLAGRLTFVPTTAPLRVRWQNENVQMKRWDVQPGQTLVFRGRFPAGDHYLEINAPRGDGVGAAYGVALDHDDPFDPTIVEPNDRLEDARPLPPDLVARVSGDGPDVFALPRLAADSDIAITTSDGSKPMVRVYVEDKPAFDILKAQGGGFSGRLPADRRAWLSIDGRGAPTEVTVRFAAGPTPVPLMPSALEVKVTLQDLEPAAFRGMRQTLRGEIALSGQGSGAHAIAASTTEHGWSVKLSQTNVQLTSGRVLVPFELVVGPGAHADRPVRIDVAVTAARSGSLPARGHAVVIARSDARAVRPERAFELPEAMLGGIDLAAGASFVDARAKPLKPHGSWYGLIDGVARRDRAFVMPLRAGTKLESMPTMQLRGERAAKIVGVTLEAVGPVLTTAVADFRVWLSQDGTQWHDVLVARLEPREGEQAFVLASPRDARFARLEIMTSHAGAPATGDGNVSLGAFKVIADPESDGSGSGGHDLAAPDNGGVVVWTAPKGGGGATANLLVDQRLQRVVGFRHARAAKVVQIAWADPAGTSPSRQLTGLTLYGSLHGPVGPWQKLGHLKAPGPLALPADTWLRYVRIESDPASARGGVNVPVLTIREAPASASYRTIVGEWGPFQRAASYERAHRDAGPAPATARGHQTRQTAFRLAKEPVHGRVERGKIEDWYVLTVGPNEQQLTLDAEGDPTLDANYELQDARGVIIAPIDGAEQSASSQRTYSVSPGATYHVRVWQPPSSVVFSWDTSGSVATWVPLVRNAVQRFSETVTPGHEKVHLLPFGGGPLLVDWEERGEYLWTALSGYTPAASSESERALRLASELLGETRGAKAVVLLTDALSPPDAGLWPTLAEVRPRVFCAGVAAGLQGEGRDRLQSWAAVESGYYDGVTSRGELDVFFERVASWLRQPASYTLKATLSAAPVAPLGTLEVVDDGKAGQSSVVEFVIDVSGSMLEKMKGGTSRIDVAKKILADAIAKDVPAGTSVAVRVFGRVGGEACGTELVAPVGPVAAASGAMPRIEAKKFAMTPIAAALKEVGQDLASVKGNKTVVLLTDGRETCGGDPSAVVRDLVEQGLGLRVNVIGFALVSASLKRTFAELAVDGGGQFFDAADGDSLATMLGAAIKAGYVVRAGNGEVVARGSVGGGPIELANGKYRVEVATTPPRVFDDVEVGHGQSRKLSLSQAH